MTLKEKLGQAQKQARKTEAIPNLELSGSYFGLIWSSIETEAKQR